MTPEVTVVELLMNPSTCPFIHDEIFLFFLYQDSLVHSQIHSVNICWDQQALLQVELFSFVNR